MAKTFKNLTPPDTAASAKRTSERDFFDLTDDSHLAELDNTSSIAPIAIRDAEVGGDDNTNNIGNTNNTGKIVGEKQVGSARAKAATRRSGNSGNTSNPKNTTYTDSPTTTSVTEKAPPVESVSNGRDVRQTFVLSQNHLEQLRDYVHARKASGDYNYSQKQALQEALDLLFANSAPVAPRPDQVRELEQQRREQIQQGRLVRT